MRVRRRSASAGRAARRGELPPAAGRAEAAGSSGPAVPWALEGVRPGPVGRRRRQAAVPRSTPAQSQATHPGCLPTQHPRPMGRLTEMRVMQDEGAAESRGRGSRARRFLLLAAVLGACSGPGVLNPRPEDPGVTSGTSPQGSGGSSADKAGGGNAAFLPGAGGPGVPGGLVGDASVTTRPEHASDGGPGRSDSGAYPGPADGARGDALGTPH
jgi:hypothetical protein